MSKVNITNKSKDSSKIGFSSARPFGERKKAAKKRFLAEDQRLKIKTSHLPTASKTIIEKPITSPQAGTSHFSVRQELLKCQKLQKDQSICHSSPKPKHELQKIASSGKGKAREKAQPTTVEHEDRAKTDTGTGVYPSRHSSLSYQRHPTRHGPAPRAQFIANYNPSGHPLKGFLLIGCNRANCTLCLIHKQEMEKSSSSWEYVPASSYLRSYKCKLCQATFSKIHELGDHILIHIKGAPPYVCTCCGKWCSTLHRAIRHLLSQHTEVTNPY